MENSPEQEHDHENALPHEDCGSRQFKGIRLRKWGRWVSEIRKPKTRKKIWLGSYPTPEQAARAYDAAVYCLRGPDEKFNFPDSLPDIPSASSLSLLQIQYAARKHASGQSTSSLPSLTGHASPSASVSEMELSGDKQKISEERLDLAPLWSLFEESDSAGIANSEKFPSIDEVSTLELNPTSQEQEEVEEGYISTDLWNFRDV